jgi:hypothetical protein
MLVRWIEEGDHVDVDRPTRVVFLGRKRGQIKLGLMDLHAVTEKDKAYRPGDDKESLEKTG